MTASYLIGIDIGTSGAKAALVDAAGKLLASAGLEYSIHTPQPGWAEQDPQDWLAAALYCTAEVTRRAGVDPDEVAGIGITGQMHSLVCLGNEGQVLRPAIIWADQRSGRHVRRLTSLLGQQNLAKWTGNPLASGFMLASWAWLREHEPSLAEQTRWLMLPKDWVRCQLTGEIGTEPSDASSTLLFDPHLRTWSRPVLSAVGLREDQLPPVSESAAVAGHLLPEIAARCGLTAGIPVVFGCSDVSAQALAQGVIEPGTVSCTIGTGGQLFAPLAQPRHDPDLRLHLFCHAAPGLWHQEAAILSAGLALRWLRDQLWKGADYSRLASEAAGVEAAMEGLYFLPYLTGERTPYMDPGLRAQFIGLELRHERAHLARAVMEGVVFSLRQGLELMESLGVPVEQMVASGGATRHRLWLQLQADIFNRPLSVFEAEEAAARGAALLAGLGVGVYPDLNEAISMAASGPVRLVHPNTVRARRYAMAYRDYKGWANLVADQYRVERIE